MTISDKKLASREKELRFNRRDASFRICRRKSLAKVDEIAPWDKEDNCRLCSTVVIYDSRDSEGIAHICAVCANSMAERGYRPLSAFRNDDIGDGVLSTDEVQRRYEQILSQSRHNENVNKPERQNDRSRGGYSLTYSGR